MYLVSMKRIFRLAINTRGGNEIYINEILRPENRYEQANKIQKFII